MTRIVNWLPLCLVLLGCGLTSCQPVTPEERQQIESFLQGYMACRGLPGVLVSAVRGGEIALAEGYGEANIDSGAPVWPNTLFGIGSVTKQFTALLLSNIMAQRNDVTWDTPVRDILGEDFFYTTGWRTNNTNLRDLLAHKTGIPRNDYLWMLQMAKNRTDLIRRLRYIEPYVDLRTSIIYNNIQYVLAGVVAEALEGRSWEDLIREHFLQPIGMTYTTFVDLDGHDRTRFATPYMNVSGVLTEVPRNIFNNSLVSSAGYIASTAYDMSLWMNFLLSGRGSSDQLIMNMSDIWATMQHDSIGSLLPDKTNPGMKPILPYSWSHSSYGYGFSLGYYKGYRVASHGGSIWGYSSHLIILPDMNVGAFISINKAVGLEPRVIPLHVLDVLLGEPWMNASYACGIDIPTSSAERTESSDLSMSHYLGAGIPLKATILAQNASKYLGIYGNFAYGNATVGNEENGNLTLNLEARFGTFELLPLEGDTFFVNGVGESEFFSLGNLTFISSQGEGSEIDQIVASGMNPGIPVPVIFIRGLRMSEAPTPRLDTC